MSVRMDRWNDPKPQIVPKMLPPGLESIGVGLGIGGRPLYNLGQISSKYFTALLFNTILVIFSHLHSLFLCCFFSSCVITVHSRLNCNSLLQPVEPI